MSKVTLNSAGREHGLEHTALRDFGTLLEVEVEQGEWSAMAVAANAKTITQTSAMITRLFFM